MPLLTDYPEIVKSYAPFFENLFTPEGYRHFRRLVSGFLFGKNHTLEGINRLFAFDISNQSSLNRFVNRQNFSLSLLNQRRVEMMQNCSVTAMNEEGILGVDGSLLHHYGTKFDEIANMWDHVTKSYGPAHELVTLYYSHNEIDYPLEYCLWQPPDWDVVADQVRALGLVVNEEHFQARYEKRQKWYTYMRTRYRSAELKHRKLRQSYKTKIHLAEDLLRRHLEAYPRCNLPLVMDSGFASNQFCRMVSEELKLSYVADIKATQVIYQSGGRKISLAEFINQLRASHNVVTKENPAGKPSFKKVSYHYRGKKKTVYAYAGVHRLGSYDKKQKIIIQYAKEELWGEPRISVTNELGWYASKILRIRRLRWPIETYHQEAKVQGLESYQVRNKKAIETHIAFVVVAYTMLTKASRDEAVLKRLREHTRKGVDITLPYMRRLLESGALWALVEYLYLNAQQGRPMAEVVKPLMSSIVY